MKTVSLSALRARARSAASRWCLVVFPLFLSVSCSETSSSFGFIEPKSPSVVYDGSEVASVSLGEELSTDMFQSEFDSVKLIMLELTDECVLSGISSIGIAGDSITVVDNGSGRICVFNSAGEFIKFVGGKGQAYGEYSQISTSAVDGRNVYITDFVMNKSVLYMEEREAETIERRNPSCRVHNVWPLSDSCFVETHGYDGMLSNSPYELTLTNSNQDLLGSARPFVSNLSRSGGELLRGSDGTLLYYADLCDTIFCVKENSLAPYLSLSLYGESELNEYYNEAFAQSHRTLARYENFKRSLPRFSFWESANFWVVQVSDAKRTYKSFVDRNTRKANSYLQFDKESGELFHLGNIHSVTHDDWVIFCFTERNLNSVSEDFFEKGLGSLRNKELESKIRSVADGQVNGAVLMMHIKERGQ